MIKISLENIPATIREIEDRWKKIEPNKPFEYRFLDEDESLQ